MSDYIFNCFKEHVTTGLACSPVCRRYRCANRVEGTTAALSPSLLPPSPGFTHGHTVFWHMHTFTLKKGAD